MPKKRVGYFILLAILALVYIMSNSHFALLLLLLSVAAPGVSLLLLLYTARQIHLDLSVPATIMPEGQRNITYTIKNSSHLPAPQIEWVVSIKTQLMRRKTDLKINAYIRKNSTEELPLSLAGLCAGKLIISTRAARVYDLFGLFYQGVNPPKKKFCLVYPRLAQFNINMHNRVESEEGNIYSQHRPGSDPTEIFALHEYAQGDDLKKVHWKLSAKTDNLIVRDFGLPLDYPVVLLLETQHVGDEEDERSLSCCLEVFISLSLSFLQQGISHNIAWYDDGRFRTEQISSDEELDAFIPVLLSAQGYPQPFLALECYANSGFAHRRMAIYYVTACRDTTAVSEALPGETIRTILVVANEKCVTDINVADGDTVPIAADSFGQLVVNL
ncbi:MAG: hypothetical protein A4E53_02878 [Pelotomaculum sp. PtaB.Bin104]|nr:MAG: hypothetical protein A4E53_02878 [Pelotomaculum sp. PtaB.Bin104]